MNVSEALQYDQGTVFYGLRKVDIRWGSIRFYNTNIEPATFVVHPNEEVSIYNQRKYCLLKIKSPDGTGQYPIRVFEDEQLHLFLSAKEAEVWKVLELEGLSDIIDKHMDALKIKTQKKLKSLKKKVKIDDYIEKYPDELLKIL